MGKTGNIWRYIQFLTQNILPVCIVSNIDRNDILPAIRYHSMVFENIITSEDAKSYKPRPEIFQMALERMKISPQQVLHIGDSLSSDILGAYILKLENIFPPLSLCRKMFSAFSITVGLILFGLIVKSVTGLIPASSVMKG